MEELLNNLDKEKDSELENAPIPPEKFGWRKWLARFFRILWKYISYSLLLLFIGYTIYYVAYRVYGDYDNSVKVKQYTVKSQIEKREPYLEFPMETLYYYIDLHQSRYKRMMITMKMILAYSETADKEFPQEIQSQMNAIKDMILERISHRDYDNLLSQRKRFLLSEEIRYEMNRFFTKGQVERIYFDTFHVVPS